MFSWRKQFNKQDKIIRESCRADSIGKGIGANGVQAHGLDEGFDGGDVSGESCHVYEVPASAWLQSISEWQVLKISVISGSSESGYLSLGISIAKMGTATWMGFFRLQAIYWSDDLNSHLN